MIPAHDPSALARAIVAGARFHLGVQHVRPRPKSWLAIAWDWVRDRYSALIDAFNAHVHVSHAAGIVTGDLALAAIAALLVVVAVRLLRELVPGNRAGSHGVAIDPLPDAFAVYDRSVRAAAAGEYARAIALLFNATVAALGLRGVVSGDASATVGEFERTLSARGPALAAPFETIARAFTAAAYAQTPIGEAEWTRARDAFARLLRESAPHVP